MDCFYINLQSAAGRRRRMEANFAAHAPAHWRLTRVAAVDARAVAKMKVPGALRPGEKGCFISHRSIIRASLRRAEPFMILEDDAVIGAQTFRIIDQCLQRQTSKDWDLIFADICVPDLRVMTDFIRMRRQRRPPDSVILLDLAGFPFAGSSAYLVNPASVAKLDGLLSAPASLDRPYDLFLRDLIRGGRIKAHVFFPFITTVSEEADASALQPSGLYAVDRVWNQFRRLMWLERDLAAQTPAVEAMRDLFEDEESDLMGVVVAAMLSEKLQLK